MNFRTLGLTGWLIVVLLILALVALGTCQARRHAAEQARRAEAGRTLADGRTKAAGDASAVRDRADARDDQIDHTVREGSDAIRDATDDAAAGGAALRSLCRLDPGADPRCRVQQPGPGRVD